MLGQNLSKLHLSDIFSARQRLPRAFSKTPLLSSELLNLQVKANLYLKAESLQPSGAYKIRGAYNKCAYLVEQHGSRLSIITASSGNHGMACAMAAAKLGICAKVVVPVSTPEIKKNCIRSLGAELIEHGETYDDSFQRACQLTEQEKEIYYVHPVSDTQVLGGQGTIGLEILEQLPSVQQVGLPLGGGGLAAGVSCGLKQIFPQIRIICVMPKGSAVYVESRKAGELVELPYCASMADAVVRKTGEPFLYPYLETYVDEIVTVSEASIAAAIQDAALYAKLTLEGAGALPLAAVKEGVIQNDLCTVLICSGGNIDRESLKNVL